MTKSETKNKSERKKEREMRMKENNADELKISDKFHILISFGYILLAASFRR